MIYADTSFLFSLYAWDANSATAASTFSKDQRRPLCLTPWQRFELRNALRLASGRLSRANQPVLFQTGSVLKAIQEDITAGRLKHVEPDWRETLHLAEDLSNSYTHDLGAASVDAWHVAAAILLRAEVFWTFDNLQYRLALKSSRVKRVPRLAGLS